MESISSFEPRSERPSVLVVDDDEDIRGAFEVLLQSEGYRVSSCSNGRDALELLHEGQASDVIVLDLMMPVMDGWQFRVEQKRDPALASIPVVAVTADRSSKAAAIDADAYLTKPVDPSTLLATIDRLLLIRERERLRARLIETDRLASLGTLAAGVAHEINNPLAYVMANVDLVARELSVGRTPMLSPSDLRLSLSRAREGLDRIRTIVRDLRTFSRPGEDRRGPLDVRKILDSCVNMVTSEIQLHARLRRDYRDVPMLLASEARLAQVFLNLVVNAIQAIPEGDPEHHEIGILTCTGPQGEVVVEVRDTGGGIAPEVIGHVFEPFYTTKPDVGTGLGLSICHGIVTQLGGKLIVESTLGEGSVFRVELPSTMTGAAPQDVEVAPSATGRRGRVLIVDDEPMLCLSFDQVLSSEHDVTTRESGAGALALIAAGERYDVILCDLMMPEMSGMALYAELSRVAPDQAERMLFMTGGAFTDDARAFTARVENRVLDKPLSLESLLAYVRQRVG